MQHAAPTSETKADTAQSKSQVVPQPERELHPHVLSTTGRYSSSGMSGAASGASPNAQRRQALAGMQSTQGNQAVLRMLHSPQQIARMAPLRPSQGIMLQRKCACGGSSETEGECEECKAKREGTLQRSAATPTVSPAAGAIQTKLAINQPGDEYEQEADRVADQVMTMPEHHTASGTPPRIQRFSRQSNGQMDAVPASVDQTLASPGRPLEPELRQDMEQRFEHDFSRVRVHDDGAAAQGARAVQARAYTVGSAIVFGSGQYAPATEAGRRLLAHELVHVVQQAAGDGCSTTGAPAVQRQLGGAQQVQDPESDVEEEVYEPWMARGEEGSREQQKELEELGKGNPPLPTYHDTGAKTDWGRAGEQRGKQVETWHHRLQLERPLVVLKRGGSLPDFITEGPKSSSLRSGAEGEVDYTPKYFHVLDAIDHDVALATAPEEVYGLFLAYFPNLQPPPQYYKTPDGKIYQPRLPAGVVVGFVSLDPDVDKSVIAGMSDEFRAALAKRARERRQRLEAEVLSEAENVALKSKGKRRRAGPCKNKRNPPKSRGSVSSNKHNKYATHVAKVKGYGAVTDELTWTTPEGVAYSFDTYNPMDKNEVWEVKTQHEWTSPLGIGNAPDWLQEFYKRITDLEVQRLEGLYIANRCGLRFKYAFDNYSAYTGFRQQWLLPPLEYIPFPEETK